VIAGPHGVRVLCLHGEAFREALATDITAAYGLIRTLAERLRKAVERGVRQQIQIQQLRIQIDEAKKARQVAEITETDYFRRLQERARMLRKRPSLPADSDQ
jgi:benzoyl-CoA reductase/2-hydroxyglutaryl-CoA dehydratase subunit BcrC/BadD/HgdB